MNYLKNNNKVSPLALAISLALTSSMVYAEDESEQSQEQSIETISVVGQSTNTVITPDALEKYQATNLSDIFRQTPSVTVGGSLGIVQKIYVRGLEDSIVNVTVDGAPQTSTLFHHIGRISIEPELLKSVEVQAGAGEATAGIGAVGGAIRFKTKNANDLLNEDERFGGSVKASYFSNDGQKSSISLYGKLTDNVNVLASYVDSSQANITDGDGNEVSGTAADQSLAFIKLNSQLTDDQSVTLSYEKRKEDGKFAKQLNWAPLADDPLFQAWGERETLVLNHNWELNNLVNLETSIYQTESSFKRELYTYSAVIKTTGFDIRNTSILGDHAVTYGIEQKNDEVTSESYSDFAGIFSEEGSVTAFYIQDHWQLNDDLLLSFGTRYDSYDLDHSAVAGTWIKVDDVWVLETDSSGNYVTTTDTFSIENQSDLSSNIGLIYSITDNLNLSVGYAQALRGREIGDAFTLERLVQNENLKPETVVNNEIGLEYNDGTFIFEASAYVSTIDDVVFDETGGSIIYDNIGELETKGVELVFGYQANNFDVVVSYNKNDVLLNNTSFDWPNGTVTLNNIQLEAYEYNGLGTSTGDSININANYQLNDALEMGVNLNHVSALDDIEVFQRSLELGWVSELNTVDKPSYNVLDAYIKYTPLENLTLNITIQNLLDETYRDHGSVADYGHIAGYESVVGINEAGRDIRLSATYSF